MDGWHMVAQRYSQVVHLYTVNKNKYGTVNRQEKVGGLVGQKDGGLCPF